MPVLILAVACGISLMVFFLTDYRLRHCSFAWVKGSCSTLLSASVAGIVLALVFIALWPPLDLFSTSAAASFLTLILVTLYLLGQVKVCQRE